MSVSSLIPAGKLPENAYRVSEVNFSTGLIAAEQSNGPRISQLWALVGALFRPLICIEVLVELVVIPAPRVLAVRVQFPLP